MGAVGVDFGTSGGAVFISRAFHVEIVRFAKVPEYQVFKVFQRWREAKGRAICEHVALRGIKKNSQGAQDFEKMRSMTVFIKAAGRVEGFMVAAQLPYQEIVDKTWQAEFGLLGMKTYAERKKKAHDIAKRIAEERGINPKLITKDVADAFLIAVYNWRKTFGELTHGKDDANHRAGTGIDWERHNQELPAMRKRRQEDSSEGAGTDSDDIWI